MIYLVSTQQRLFSSEFKLISIEESLDLLKTFGTYIQYDSETLGLDPHIGKILCAQFGNIDKSIQIVVDCTTIDLSVYKEVLESHYLIGHNLCFDLKWLFNYNIVPLKVYDTMIIEQLIYLSYPRIAIGMNKEQIFKYKTITSNYNNWDKLKSAFKKQVLYEKDAELADFIYNHAGFSLKALVYRYLNKDMDKSVRGQIQYKGLTDDVILYSAHDVVELYDIMQLQLAILRERDMLKAGKVECDFTLCNAYYEWCGVKLDIPRWQKKMQKDLDEMNTALEALNQFVIDYGDKRFFEEGSSLFEGFYKRCTINWKSSNQIIPFLTTLGFNCTGIDKDTKEEKESAEAKVLKGQKGINDDFLKIYFNFTEASKVVSTYGQSYINAINPNTGRIHTQFRAIGTDTGRLACGSQNINTDLARLKGLPLTKVKDTAKICAYPQLQNLPNDEETRACFIAEEGNDFISIDYNSEESRLLASLANDKAMLEVFELGQDMHSKVAYMIYPDKIPRETKIENIKKEYHDLRQSAKGPEFCFAFLGNWNTLVANYGMSPEEAQSIENNYKKGFSGATEYQNKCQRFVENNGYIIICKETNHKAYWWDYEWWKSVGDSFTKEFWEEYRLYHKGTKDSVALKVKEHFQAKSKWDKNSVNSTTQGLGAVIFKIFNYRFFVWLVQEGYFGKVKFCVPAHDEICIECPKELTSIIVPKLKYFMSSSGEMFCHRLPMPAEEEISTCWKH